MRNWLGKLPVKSIHWRLFILVMVILISSFTIMGFQQALNLTSVIENDALEKAKSDLSTGLEIIDLTYPGDWRVEDGMLYKGETLINYNHDIVDRIGELTGGDSVTIFLGDTRVSTNLYLGGQRATGTKASSAVIGKVLQKGEMYLGAADVVGNTYQTAYTPIRDANGEVIGMFYVGAPDADARIEQVRNKAQLILGITGVVILVVAFLLFYWITRPMIRRIQESVKLLRIMAGGDLSHREMSVMSDDETGMLQQAVNKMLADTRTIINRVKDSSMLVASSSEELSANIGVSTEAAGQIREAVHQVASGDAEQLKGVTESTEAILEVNKGMAQVADAIQNMADFSSAASGNAGRGGQVVARNIEQMNRIRQTAVDAAEAIHSLESRSREIDEIVVVITEIANQTNLLALNASIEAARAGEHGRGFAVVAAEVKKLAEQSASSAEMVSQRIREIQADSRRAAIAMKAGSEAVEEGIRQAEQSGNMFGEIAGAIGEISFQAQEVSAVVEQVYANTESAVHRMQLITEILHQTNERRMHILSLLEEQGASMEEISKAVAHLANMADELQQLTGTFTV